MSCLCHDDGQVAAASVKTEVMDYTKPVRPALYTGKITVPTEVSCQINFLVSTLLVRTLQQFCLFALAGTANDTLLWISVAIKPEYAW